MKRWPTVTVTAPAILPLLGYIIITATFYRQIHLSFIILFLTYFHCDEMTLGKRRAFSACVLSDVCSGVNVACDDDSGTSIERSPHRATEPDFRGGGGDDLKKGRVPFYIGQNLPESENWTKEGTYPKCYYVDPPFVIFENLRKIYFFHWHVNKYSKRNGGGVVGK